MKYKIILVFLCIYLGLPSLLSAQKVKVNNICYEEHRTEVISVSKTLDLNTLTNLDKLNFKKRAITKKYQEYFDKKDQLTREVLFLSQEDYFPPWYTPPSRIKINNFGTETYFEQPTVAANSRNIKEDHRVNLEETTNGRYLSNLDNGKKYLSKPHSEKSKEAYLNGVHAAKTKGLIHKFTFEIPAPTNLERLRAEGYQVHVAESVIEAKDLEKRMVWYLEKRIVLQEYVEDNGTKSTIQMEYSYNDAIGRYLLKRKVVSTPEQFMNGTSFNRMSIMVYSNFSTSCLGEEPIVVNETEQLTVFPNPSLGTLNITLPKGDEKSKLSVIDVAGSLIKSRNVRQVEGDYSLNVKDLPSGVYLVKIEKGENIFMSKFVKQ